MCNVTISIRALKTEVDSTTTRLSNNPIEFWIECLMMKILLIAIVYLTHCEGETLLNWGWFFSDTINAKPRITTKMPAEMLVVETVTIDRSISDEKHKAENNESMQGDTTQSTDCVCNIAPKDANRSDCDSISDTHEHEMTSGTPLSENAPAETDNVYVYVYDTTALEGNQFDKKGNLLKQEIVRESMIDNSVDDKKSVMSLHDKKNIDIMNYRPIIGILSQEQSSHLSTKYPVENYTSYISASYVKLVESSGARVVPIMIGKDRKYYEDLMSKINGVLFPGGATYFNQSNGFADAGQYIYEIAQELNDAGQYFPIFGICLGFELLVILASGRGRGEKENRSSCHSYSSRTLQFTSDFRDSKMFAGAGQDIVDVLANENVTTNAHQFCITAENMEKHELLLSWRVTSHSTDDNGKEFVSSIEHKRYPFYGVQFHPEKSQFEWKLSKDYPHTENSITANRYFMDFFVNESRKSSHEFKDVNEENEHLIYNYAPKFTGVLGSVYQQCYFFEPKGTIVGEL